MTRMISRHMRMLPRFEPTSDKDPLLVAYQAIRDRDLGVFQRALKVLEDKDPAVDPFMPALSNPEFSGSFVGLCASVQWHDGLRACRDAGLRADRNAIVREPMMWAMNQNDVVSAKIILDMHFEPMRPWFDHRLAGIHRPWERLTRLTLLRFVKHASMGWLDRIALQRYVHQGVQGDMRPIIGSLLLQVPRAHCVPILESIVDCHPELITKVDVRFFAQFAYFQLIENDQHQGRIPPRAQAMRELFAITPNEDMVKDRLATEGDPFWSSWRLA
jgi:hypothetical protein